MGTIEIPFSNDTKDQMNLSLVGGSIKIKPTDVVFAFKNNEQYHAYLKLKEGTIHESTPSN